MANTINISGSVGRIMSFSRPGFNFESGTESGVKSTTKNTSKSNLIKARNSIPAKIDRIPK